MFSSLIKMSNPSAANYVFKQMLWLVAFGYLVPNVSNAAHIGGFIGGALVGYLFGPGYFMSRGRSLDTMEPEFRSVIGPGK
jgi:membrane associated rhomboid family serine protease